MDCCCMMYFYEVRKLIFGEGVQWIPSIYFACYEFGLPQNKTEYNINNNYIKQRSLKT